mmetsp:Transcript_35951/g.90786  ORF Transcript_35951/g.90786 Transcript_35951/m.90786 type:complete len:309 (-) Transcript_35951:47-973(-)
MSTSRLTAPVSTSAFTLLPGSTSTSPSGVGVRAKPHSSRKSTPPAAAATRVWNAALVVLMVLNFSSPGALHTLPMYLASVAAAVRQRSSSVACVFFIATRFDLSRSSTVTGLTCPKIFRLASSASRSAAAAFSASRAFSSSVSSSGRPSFLRRSRRSSSSCLRIFSLARASSSFSRCRCSTMRFMAPSSSFFLAASSSLPARMRSRSRCAASSRSSRSRFSLAALISSAALRLRSSGVSLDAASSLACVTSSGASMSASPSWSISHCTAASAPPPPEWYTARTALLCPKPMPSSSLTMSASTAGSTMF